MFLGNHHSRSYIGVTASSDDYYFHYSTGDRLQWTNWGPNRPNKEPNDKRCVVMEWHPTDSGERDLVRFSIFNKIECNRVYENL